MTRMKDSDKIPRLFVETPTISLSMVRPVEAAIEIIATLPFRSWHARLMLLFAYLHISYRGGHYYLPQSAFKYSKYHIYLI